MKVILQQKVGKLGRVGDKVTVKPGYGRNYLIPFGKAMPATAENIELFEKKRAEFEKAEQELLGKAQQRAEQLSALSITIEAQSGEEGKLFGSIGPRDIAEKISESGIELQKSEVMMPEGPIRRIGEYEISVKLHSDVLAIVKLLVTPSANG